jgi:hypothetical protein
MFAYDGWNGFTAMSGEVRNPGRTIPVSLATGVITVAAVCVIVNLAYFSVLPLELVQKSSQVAVDAVAVMAGRTGTAVIALLVMLSTFSSLNATVITDPRICFAMSKIGLFFGSVSRVHPRWGTPYVAIVLNASLACLYVLAATFDQLAEAFVLGVWLFARCCRSSGASVDTSRFTEAVSDDSLPRRADSIRYRLCCSDAQRAVLAPAFHGYQLRRHADWAAGLLGLEKICAHKKMWGNLSGSSELTGTPRASFPRLQVNDECPRLFVPQKS